MRPECEQFTGRQQEICEGTADLPASKINAYRMRWGLEPLDGTEVRERRPTSPVPPRERPTPTPRPKPTPEPLAVTALYLTCEHRGDVLGTVTGTQSGCGCGSTRVHVYQCNHDGKPTMKDCKQWAWKNNAEKIKQVVPTYDGRTCRGCPVPEEEARAAAAQPQPDNDMSGWMG